MPHAGFVLAQRAVELGLAENDGGLEGLHNEGLFGEPRRIGRQEQPRQEQPAFEWAVARRVVGHLRGLTADTGWDSHTRAHIHARTHAIAHTRVSVRTRTNTRTHDARMLTHKETQTRARAHTDTHTQGHKQALPISHAHTMISAYPPAPVHTFAHTACVRRQELHMRADTTHLHPRKSITCIPPAHFPSAVN